MPNNNPTGINQYTKGGKRPSGKISKLQKVRASIKKSIGIAEKKSGKNLSVLKSSAVRSATKFSDMRLKSQSNAFHIAHPKKK